MIYLNGVEYLSSPTIQGTVDPGTGLTMPAFIAGGDIVGAATAKLGSAASPFAEAFIGNTNDYLKVAIAGNIPTLYGTGAYLRVGDAGIAVWAATEDALLVTGGLESLTWIGCHEGLFTDGPTGGVADISFMENSSGRFIVRADYNREQCIWALSADVGMQLLLISSAYSSGDFGIAPQVNPLFCVFSAANPAVDNTQYVAILHNQVDGVVDSAKGTLNLGGTANVNFAGAVMGGGTVTHDDYVELEVAGVVKKFMTGS